MGFRADVRVSGEFLNDLPAGGFGDGRRGRFALAAL